MGRFGERSLVQSLEEGHRLQVLLAAVLVGDPLPALAVVIQIQHGRHRVHPQTVNVVFLQPVHRAGHQEADHFGLSEVKHQGAPLLVLPFPGVLVLVAGCAVKGGKARGVLGEVGRDPVHNDPDPRLVAPVHKAHKVFGLAVTGGGGEIAHHLVAPGAIVGILGQGHKLNVGEPHVLHIGDQLVPQLVVGEHAAVSVLPPGAGVDLVDVHRLLVMGMVALLLEPFPIVPVVPFQFVPAGSRARAGLRVPGKGVGLVGVPPLGGFHVKLVQLEGLEDKIGISLPHSVIDLAQGILGLVPVAEIAHQGHLPGMRRPNPGHHALFPLMGGLVQTQVLIRAAVGAAAEQIQGQIIRLFAGAGILQILLTFHDLNAPFPPTDGFFIVIIS